jgi:hypothetical protein
LFFLAIALSLVRGNPLGPGAVAIIAFGATALALLSKESAVVFPILLGLAWIVRRERARLVAVVASGLAVAAYMAIRADVILFPAVRSDAYAWKLSNVPERMVEYALFPFSLNRFETIAQPDRPLAWLACILCLLMLSALASLGWRWVVGLLAVFYGALGPVLILSFSANHYAYLATALVCALLTVAWTRLGSLARAVLAVCVLAITIHGMQMMRTMYRVGTVQSILFLEIDALLRTSGERIAVRAANEKDNFIVDRLLHDIPEYLGRPWGNRVSAAPAGAKPHEITHRMQRDGRLTKTANESR